MRSVAIIGSGIVGLLTAHGMRRAGLAVTLYSDRTAAQWLDEARPTGTAARFDLALAYERELGLNHWEAQAPRGGGVHFTFSLKRDNRLLTLAGRLATYFQAVDVRLQSARWMADLEARGGRVVVESVSAERLDAIAAEHDLTVVAGGRAELSRLFERHAGRSVYDRPQRKLGMLMVRGPRLGFDGVPFLPVKFNFFAPYGEAFWVPYFHKDVGPSWSLLFEAREGGPMDRFSGAKSGEEALAVGKEVIRDLMPWDWEWAREMELADRHGWLVGGVAPTVRHPVARLPSGRVVTAVGDTVMSLDPIAGQGANNGVKMARHLVESVAARGDGPLDEKFLVETFEGFWERHGANTVTFNNMLLEPITAAGKEVLIAQYGSDGASESGRQRIADAFVATFVGSTRLMPAFNDMRVARALVEELSGQWWLRRAVGGRLAIARNQLRQALGLPPRHPLVAHAAPPSLAPRSAAD